MIQFTHNGQTHQVSGGAYMMRILGQSTGRQMIMSDEGGQINGAGVGVAGLQKSMPLIKSLKEAQQLHKTSKPLVKATRNTSILAKSSTTTNKLSSMLADLETLAATRLA